MDRDTLMTGLAIVGFAINIGGLFFAFGKLSQRLEDLKENMTQQSVSVQQLISLHEKRLDKYEGWLMANRAPLGASDQV